MNGGEKERKPRSLSQHRGYTQGRHKIKKKKKKAKLASLTILEKWAEPAQLCSVRNQGSQTLRYSSGGGKGYFSHGWKQKDSPEVLTSCVLCE